MTRNVFTIRAIAAAIAMVFLGIALPARCADPASAARLPVPADGDVAKSRKKIRDAYEVEYKAAKESGEPSALLDKLRKEADSAPEPVQKYAFLLEVEDVAAQHDDAAATLTVVDRRAELFEIDSLAERSKTLARLAGPRIVADLALLEQAMATATKAAAAERFDIATDSATLALKIAQAIDREQKAVVRRRQQRKPAAAEVVPVANGVVLIKSALDLQKRIGKRKDLFTACDEAKAVLTTQPDDPAANAAAGTYLCFVAQNWAQGLPHLKKSGLTTLGELAAEELALGDPASEDAAKIFSLAGKWWEAAEAKALSEDERIAVRDHASRLYAAVRPRLNDPLEIRVADTRGDKHVPAVGPSPAPKQIVNSIGMKLTLIPAGTFQMGQNDGEGDEHPVHEVRITKPFYVGVYEVTNAQWKALMGDVPSRWKDDDQPVEGATWEQAVAFCSVLSDHKEERAAGRVYRLPTEAEWEYACRAGTTKPFAFRNDDEALGDYGWFAVNAGGQTHGVGRKKPNPWGLYDMHGNVWEWCSDWYGGYSSDGEVDPQGPSQGSGRVCRGGCWRVTDWDCRAANREVVIPSDRGPTLGFRLAMSPSGTSTLVSGTDSKPSERAFQPPADAVVWEKAGNAYKVFGERLSWHDAKKRCEDLGGHLVAITSFEENRFVRTLLATSPHGGRCWIGATDASHVGNWKWVDGSEMTFSAWGVHEPNNTNGVEHYVEMESTQGLWNDADANFIFVTCFVCEWEKDADDPLDRQRLR